MPKSQKKKIIHFQTKNRVCYFDIKYNSILIRANNLKIKFEIQK